MKTVLFRLLPIIGFLFLIPSCEKSEKISGEVEFYLLKSFETVDNTCEISASSVDLESYPLIAYSDIKSYSSKDYVFRVTNDAVETIEALEHSVLGLPFAVTADDELIYTGYFWPSYSSAMCQWIVIDPLMWGGNNELHVELGYPGTFEGVVIPDERNNEKILDIFRRDGKLKE